MGEAYIWLPSPMLQYYFFFIGSIIRILTLNAAVPRCSINSFSSSPHLVWMYKHNASKWMRVRLINWTDRVGRQDCSIMEKLPWAVWFGHLLSALPWWTTSKAQTKHSNSLKSSFTTLHSYFTWEVMCKIEGQWSKVSATFHPNCTSQCQQGSTTNSKPHQIS